MTADNFRLVPEKLGDPIRWSTPRRIFVNSMSDLFHEEVPDEYIEKAAHVTLAANLQFGVDDMGCLRQLAL